MAVNTSEQIFTDPFREQSKQKSCSNCGVSFGCGPRAGKESCWCEDLPQVSLVGAAEQDCLCPECLRQVIADLQLNSAGTRPAASQGQGVINSPPILVEGEDYYCEGPAIVFTAKYLLRRGYCCESGCRHCPYETAQVNNQAISAPQ
jgi:hypothetical protein